MKTLLRLILCLAFASVAKAQCPTSATLTTTYTYSPDLNAHIVCKSGSVNLSGTFAVNADSDLAGATIELYEGENNSPVGTGQSITYVPAGANSFSASVSKSGCPTLTTNTLSISAVQLSAADQSSFTLTICSGEDTPVEMDPLGIAAPYRWYVGPTTQTQLDPATDGGSFDADPLNPNRVYNTPALTSSITYYVSFYAYGCENPRRVAHVEVAPYLIPTNVRVNPANYTAGQVVTLLADGCQTQPLIWYTETNINVTLAPIVATPITQVFYARCQSPYCAVEGRPHSETLAVRASALPVTLVRFSAQTQPGLQTLLSWETAQERANDHFRVERSRDARQWTALGNVPGKGDSQLRQAYSFTDETARRGFNYYRLVQVDTDKTETASKLAMVATDGGIVLSPNPSSGPLRVEGIATPTRIEVLDQLGRTRQSAVLTADGELDLSGLSTGMYLIRYHDGVVPRSRNILLGQ